MSIYTEAKALELEMDNHESDLYLRISEKSLALVRAYRFRGAVRTFKDASGMGFGWLDIPFAFDPWWEARRACSVPS